MDPVNERNAGGGAGPAAYDYLLVVGPGRSGSTYLHRLLKAHPSFAAPRIKEGHYYRSTRRFDRALRGPRGSGAILFDIANTAWADPRLASVADLCCRGHRILLVVLLRRHRERAVSVMTYKRSRVLPAVFAGPGGLERAALDESLSAEALARIFTLGADVLTVGFDTLVGNPGAVLAALSRLCATPPFAPPGTKPVNASVSARHPLLGATARLAAKVLRTAGAHRLLQALKDDTRIVRLFFRPVRPEERVDLSAGAAAEFDRRFEACLAALEAACEPLGEGLWFMPDGNARRGPQVVRGGPDGARRRRGNAGRS